MAGKNKNGSAASIGFEENLWAAADKMRGNMEPSEYKHVALGLSLLKYISEAFEAKHADLRDLLLPKRMSGEIRLADAEQEVAND